MNDAEVREQELHDRLMAAREARKAQLIGIADRLDGCFEPTVPMTPIVSELVPAVRDAIAQLRQLSRFIQ